MDRPLLALQCADISQYGRHWFGIRLEAGHELNGRKAAIRFLAAYLVEKSLSLDNIFIVALIFASFRAPTQYQHRVLFWRVLGALVLRGAMIGGVRGLFQSRPKNRMEHELRNFRGGFPLPLSPPTPLAGFPPGCCPAQFSDSPG